MAYSNTNKARRLTPAEYREALEKIAQRKLSDAEFNKLLNDPQARRGFKQMIEQEQSQKKQEKNLRPSKFENLKTSHDHFIPVKGEKVSYQLVPAHTAKKFAVPSHYS